MRMPRGCDRVWSWHRCTWCTCTVRLSVGGLTAFEMMSLHYAGVAFAFRLSDNVDEIARLEQADIDFVADFDRGDIAGAELSKVPELAKLLNVARFSFGEFLCLAEANLDGIIAFIGGCFDLGYRARPGFDYRDSFSFTVFAKDLGHT